MKKHYIKNIILILSLLIFCVGSSEIKYVFANTFNKPISIVMNGEELKSTIAPRMEKGRVLVPLKTIFNALGSDVNWSKSTKTIITEVQGKRISLQIGQKYATVNNNRVLLDTPAMILDGTTYVPLRFISESANMNVMWNNQEQRVLITSNEEILYYETGEVSYKGELNVQGKRQGFGREYAKTGELIYEGQWVNDIKEGKGKFSWKNLDTYIGEIKDNEAHGEGILKHYGVGVYEGTFEKGKRCGQGIFKWQNGDKYVGNWEDDMMNGKGNYIFSDGTCYSAEFKDNKIIKVYNKFKMK